MASEIVVYIGMFALLISGPVGWIVAAVGLMGWATFDDFQKRQASKRAYKEHCEAKADRAHTSELHRSRKDRKTVQPT